MSKRQLPAGFVVPAQPVELHRRGRPARVRACLPAPEGIVSKRLGSAYRSGPCSTWIKVKNPAAFVQRKMPTVLMNRAGANTEIDFFISRRGGAAATAQEAAEVLQSEGYTVFVQDFDIPHTADFIAAMDEGLKRCRHLLLLLTEDYAASKYTMMEVTNFVAAAARSADERRLAIVCLDDCEPEGILASRVYTSLAGVVDPQERKARILAAAEGRSTAAPRRHKLFENVAPRDQNFTGRDDRLAEIHQLLTEPADKAVPPLAIYGLGGTGKSSLAAEYAHRYANDYSGVYWASAEQRTVLVSGLATLAGKLDPRLMNLPDQETAAKAGLARLAAFATPFLLIYDNVETPEALRDLLPAAGAMVLVTTRWTDWAGRATEMKLEVLTEDAAAQFLQTRAGRTDLAGANRLANALGCLPLALDHAGAYCRLVGKSLSFDDYRAKIDARITRPPKGYPDSVARTFSTAIEKAAGEQAQAETLLGIFAFLAPERIPLQLITDGMFDVDDRAEALAALSSVSLIENHESDDGSAAVTLHRLVQAAMRAQLVSESRTSQLLETILDRLTDLVPEAVYENLDHWPQCAQLLPHVLAFREHATAAKMQQGKFALLSDRMGEFLYARGSLDLAKTFFQQAVDVGNTAFGPRTIEVAKALNNLALAAHDLNPQADVEQMYREALDIEREQAGADHPSYARTLANLALLMQELGRIEEADALLREAIALGEKNLGRGHPDVAQRLQFLAMLLHSKGQTAEAEALLREAIELGQKSLGRAHLDLVARLNGLATILERDARREEAEPFYRDAIEICETLLGAQHPDLATLLQNLANLLRDIGRVGEAEPLYLRAVDIYSLNLGADHIYTARAKTNLAKLLLVSDRPKAHDLAQAALAIHSKALGEAHPWTRDAKAVLGSSIEPRPG
jgi:tetratricopeptide (TPR) repeat protein